MTCSITEVKTKDELVLHGLFLEATKSRYVFIFVHGTGSNFYENYFIYPLANDLNKRGGSILSTNNRGSDVLQAYPPKGAATELFEDCLKDIDAWIKFVLSKGYTSIILAGHSLGSEKVIYYMSKGKYKSKIKGIALLGFSDSFGTQQIYTKGKDYLMEEAKNLVKGDKGNIFLTSRWFSHAGVLPKSAKSYINFFEEKSELSKILPLRKGKNLLLYRKISVPILAVIGDIVKGKGHEYTILPIKDAMNLLKKENALTKCYQIKNCNHDFEGKEIELTNIIGKWVSRIL